MSRRKWVYRPSHPKASELGFVAYEDLYGAEPEEKKAVHAPILVDRYLEGQATIDGKDIGSRQKLREYMKRENVTHASDYGPDYGERVKRERERAEDKERRNVVGRAWWENVEGGKH